LAFLLMRLANKLRVLGATISRSFDCPVGSVHARRANRWAEACTQGRRPRQLVTLPKFSYQ
jgi:hypothetical protein